MKKKFKLVLEDKSIKLSNHLMSDFFSKEKELKKVLETCVAKSIFDLILVRLGIFFYG